MVVIAMSCYIQIQYNSNTHKQQLPSGCCAPDDLLHVLLVLTHLTSTAGLWRSVLLFSTFYTRGNELVNWHALHHRSKK